MYKRFAEMYEGRNGLYERFHHTNFCEVVWHRFLPEGITHTSLEHRQYLFGANLLDVQTKAERAFKVASRLWVENRQLFGSEVLGFGSESEHHCYEIFPESLVGNYFSTERMLADRLKKIGYTSPNQMAPRWLGSFSMLWRDFEGDPLKIFDVYKTVGSYLEARKESKKGRGLIFPGLGVKLFSLLAFHLEEFGLISHVEGSLPVDLHLQSQHLSTGVVSGFGIHRAVDLEEFIRPRAVEVCYKNNISPFVIAAAMWFNGSENCVRCEKGRNTGQQKVIAVQCPVYHSCYGRVRTVKLYRELGAWNLSDQKGEQSDISDPALFSLTSPKKTQFRTYRSRRSGKLISGR